MSTTTLDTTTVRRWKRYPQYRSVNHQWLSSIPSPWTLKRISWLFGIMGSGTTPSTSDESYFGGDIPWVNTGDLNDSVIDEIQKTVTDQAIKDHSALKVYPAGTLLVALYGATIGKLGILLKPAVTNQACFAMACPKEVESHFLLYWLLGNRQQIVALSYGGGQPNISGELIRRLRVSLPPLSEQRAIAAFLDRETTRIDTLIGHKERLIALLEEKRQAVISHALTRGLNPSAPMKDAGVPAVGVVPAHWGVRRNKFLFREVDERSLAGDEDLLTVSHITGVTPRSEKPDVTMFLAESNEGHKVCHPGDLVINTMWAFMGAVGVSPKEGACAHHTTFTGPEIRRRLSRHSWNLLYRIEAYKCEMLRFSKGIWHSRLRLYPDAFMNMLTIQPPRTEQEHILKNIDFQTVSGRALVATLQDSIARLQEYRTALISAAVTGQIDVCGEVPGGVS